MTTRLAGPLARSWTFLTVSTLFWLLLPASTSADAGPFLSDVFLVNTVTNNSQNTPGADTNAAGAAVVVWTCNDGVGGGICAQRYNSAGIKSGPEIAVNTTTAEVQQSTDVAVQVDGSFLVVWESLHQDGDDWGIFGRLYDSSGVPVTPERRLSAAIAERQRYPVVAAQPGGFVVGWESNSEDLFEQVYIRRFDKNFVALGNDVRVNSPAAGAERNVAIASDASGNFAVVWQALSSEVFARRYSSSGTAKGGQFAVNVVSNSLGAPAIDMASDGRFAITWEGLDSDSAGIWVRSYSAGGGAAGAENQVNQHEIGLQLRPSVAIGEDGRYYVTWQSFAQEAPSQYATYVRPFSAVGQPTADEILVAERAQNSVISLDESGEALIVWQGSGPDVFGRRWQSELRPCIEGDYALCLSNDRFKVEAAWRKTTGETGSGRTLPLTSDTGTFWFFRDSNLESVIKILNGCPSNGRFWVFAAGVTDLYVDLMVTDTVSGEVKVFNNKQRQPFVPIQNTSQFGNCQLSHSLVQNEERLTGGGSRVASDEVMKRFEESGLATSLERLRGIELAASSGVESGFERREERASGSCVPSNTSLCLDQKRFRIEANFDTGSGNSGAAHPFPLTDDSGYFWFFRETNVELLVKVLNACSLNNRFWLFAAGLTNVAVDITITDTATGTSKTYKSQKGNAFEPILDTDALAVCSG